MYYYSASKIHSWVPILPEMLYTTHQHAGSLSNRVISVSTEILYCWSAESNWKFSHVITATNLRSVHFGCHRTAINTPLSTAETEPCAWPCLCVHLLNCITFNWLSLTLSDEDPALSKDRVGNYTYI